MKQILNQCLTMKKEGRRRHLRKVGRQVIPHLRKGGGVQVAHLRKGGATTTLHLRKEGRVKNPLPDPLNNRIHPSDLGDRTHLSAESRTLTPPNGSVCCLNSLPKS